MTIEDIKKIIANDESRVLELKKSTGELVKGGVIVILQAKTCKFCSNSQIAGSNFG